jgi:hypothetical protein
MGDHKVDERDAGSSSGHTNASKGWLTSPPVRTLPLLLPAMAGFAIVQVRLGGDAKFTGSDEFLVWSGLIAVTVAVWVAMSLSLFPTVRELRSLFGNDGPAIPVRGLVGIYAMYAALLAVVFIRWAQLTLPLGHSSFRIRAILAIGLAAGAPTIVALWLISERLRRLYPLLAGSAPLSNAGDRVEELRTLWRCSVRSLATASVAVSLAVVMLGALRNALLAYDPTTWEAAFPASTLLLYGAFFTVAFAAVYMPTLLTWRSRARQLVDAVYPIPDDGKPDEAWMKGRAALEQLVGINIGITAQLSSMLAIFGPLAASFLAGFIPQLASGQ